MKDKKERAFFDGINGISGIGIKTKEKAKGIFDRITGLQDKDERQK